MMDTKASATLDIAIPEDDGSIARALSDLELKLTAWADAIADAHAQLERAAEASGPAHPPDAPSHQRESAGAVEVPPPAPVRETEDASAAPEPVDLAVREPAADEPPLSGAASEPADLVEDEAAVVTTDVVSFGDHALIADGEDLTAATVDPSPDDRELLESLDEDTRQAVQLMRRLSPTKPLSELIETHRAAVGSAPDPKGRKKSWWKRGT